MTKTSELAARVLAGLLAAGTALGVGELIAVAVDPSASPFYAVGDTTVDRTPAWAREFAIDTFGTNDKSALFVGMTIAIILFGAIVGLLERPRRPVGSAILVLLGLVATYAAVSRPGAGVVNALPTVVGVAAGVFVLRKLIGTLSTTPNSSSGATFPRRRFIVLASTAAAVAAAAGAVGRYANRRSGEVVADRARFRLPFVADRAAQPAPGTDIGVEGASTFVTSNASFYRIDTALRLPRLTTEDWRLRIHGMVDRELTLDWPALLERTPVERLVTLTCVSNEVGGDLAGNAAWVGFPIKDILDEVGVHPDADMLLSKSADGWTCGTPVQVLRDGRDALLAIAMNGQPLPLEHGYPVRQVVPGLYGYVSATKWVVDWELTTFDRVAAYWTVRGWSERGPIKTASRIEVPDPVQTLRPGRVVVAGTAWAQHRGLSQVQIRVDNGGWQRANLAPQYSIDTWRQWTWEWDAAPGRHTLQVRATDLDGAVQTEALADPIPDGATGWHTRTFVVSA